jgi:type II secretory pathway pseudopilin PulG
MKDRSQAGFSYIDVMIALVILLVGVLALLSGISGSIIQARAHEQQLLAKQVATSTMESIMSVKETDPLRLGWKAVGNVGSNPVNGVNQGIFLTGWQSVYSDPGADEVIGTADDTGTVTPNLQRRIVITDVCDPDRPSPTICNPAGLYDVKVRSVTVTIQYNVGGLLRQENLTTMLTDYSITSQ